VKRVLLTGASGFIGHHCIGPLAAHGYEVHAVSSRKITGDPTANWHHANLLDPSVIAALVHEVRPSHLLHMAWDATPGKYWTSIDNLRWVASSLSLFHAFAETGGTRIVAAGTCAEYEWRSGMCTEEATPLIPATPYGIYKHSLQLMLGAFCQQTGITGAWGRIFSLYGPAEYPQRLVASAVRALLSGEDAKCGNANLVRDYSHAADIAGAFVALLESNVAGAVNIGSGHGIHLGDIMLKIGELLDAKDRVKLSIRPPDASGEPEVLIANTARLAAIGWKPQFDLDSGLADTIAWWRRQLNH
jgi:nucleoside-diphosphate-sugar epimerase